MKMHLVSLDASDPLELELGERLPRVGKPTVAVQKWREPQRTGLKTLPNGKMTFVPEGLAQDSRWSEKPVAKGFKVGDRVRVLSNSISPQLSNMNEMVGKEYELERVDTGQSYVACYVSGWWFKSTDLELVESAGEREEMTEAKLTWQAACRPKPKFRVGDVVVVNYKGVYYNPKPRTVIAVLWNENRRVWAVHHGKGDWDPEEFLDLLSPGS